MNLTPDQMLAAKRLRDTLHIGFPESFALVVEPECDVQGLAEQERKIMEETRAAIYPEVPEIPQ